MPVRILKKMFRVFGTPLKILTATAILATGAGFAVWEAWTSSSLALLLGAVWLFVIGLAMLRLSTLSADSWFEKLRGGDRPVAANYEAPPKPEQAKDLQEVMFFTNRLIYQDEPLALDIIYDTWSSLRTYGRAWVSIPREHAIGVVEIPRFVWWKLRQERQEPARHFMLIELSQLTDEAFFRSLDSPSKSAMVFVHGYNTTFQGAIFKAAQIAFDINFPGKVIAFSWPSRAQAPFYDYDRENALASSDTLLTLLQRIKLDGEVENIFLVAHSLGSQIVVDALRMASAARDDLNLREVIFAAPDVDRNVFTARAEFLRAVGSGVTLYASSADKALIVSKTKAGGLPRAGDMPATGPLLIPGVDLIDVTALGDDMFALNHGIFASERSVLDDLGRIIMSSTRPPHVRTPTLQRMPDRASTKYWMYPY